MRHEDPFFLFKSEKKTDEGQLKQMREAPRIYSFFFFGLMYLDAQVVKNINATEYLYGDSVTAPGEGLSIWRFTSKLFRFRFISSFLELMHRLRTKGVNFSNSRE